MYLWKILIFIIVSIPISGINSQNLVPNGDFEQHLGDQVLHWTQPQGPNYHHHTNGKFGAPYEGKRFSGICVSNNEYSEGMSVKMLKTLEKGKTYKISFYIRKRPGTLSTYNFDVSNEIQWYFSVSQPNIFSPALYPVDETHLVRIALKTGEDIYNWQYFETEYTAGGNEQFATVSYFALTDPEKPVKPIYLTNLDLDKGSKKKKKRMENHPIIDFYKEGYEPFRVRYYFDNICIMEKSESSANNCEIPLAKVLEEKEKFPEYKELQIGNSYTLNNIFFEFDKSILLPKSFNTLDSLAGLMTGNPNMGILVKGHTDNFGSPDYNLNLSKERARAVMEYLVSKGIGYERLSFKGYGETQPIRNNDTDINRQINRRVEFEVLRK